MKTTTTATTQTRRSLGTLIPAGILAAGALWLAGAGAGWSAGENPSPPAPANRGVLERLAELEKRVAELEARLARRDSEDQAEAGPEPPESKYLIRPEDLTDPLRTVPAPVAPSIAVPAPKDGKPFHFNGETFYSIPLETE